MRREGGLVPCCQTGPRCFCQGFNKRCREFHLASVIPVMSSIKNRGIINNVDFFTWVTVYVGNMRICISKVTTFVNSNCILTHLSQ